MLAILHSLGMFVADLFKSRCRLEAESLFLHHQHSIAFLPLFCLSPCAHSNHATGADFICIALI